jgi:RimJ/RimL family protein N-acetyltransferase
VGVKMETTNLLEQNLFHEAVVGNVIDELKKLKLAPKDYINIANALLDLALNKSVEKINIVEHLIDDVKLVLPISYEDVIIRKLNFAKDKKLIETWTSNDFGKEFLLSRIDNEEYKVEDLLHDEKNIFGIVETADKIPIGILGFLNHDKVNKKAELRKLIGNREYSGKGFGKKASKIWISYGLNTVGLRKIYIYTFDTNLRNIRINKELGFNLEGMFKAENICNEEVKDIIRMALIAKR